MLAARFRSRTAAIVRPWRLHQCRSIVAAPGSQTAANLRVRKETQAQPGLAEILPAAAKETEMTETFNIDASDPWKGLPDFISFTNRVVAGCIDVSLCTLVSAPVGEVALAMGGTSLKPAIFTGTALFMLRDALPFTGGRSPGKCLMGVHIHAIDETRLPRTKQGKRQRGRAYPTWNEATFQARLKRNAHYGVLLPMCIVGYPPDWVLLAGMGYCAILEGALCFYLQRTGSDMIGATAVVRKDKTQ